MKVEFSRDSKNWFAFASPLVHLSADFISPLRRSHGNVRGRSRTQCSCIALRRRSNVALTDMQWNFRIVCRNDAHRHCVAWHCP